MKGVGTLPETAGVGVPGREPKIVDLDDLLRGERELIIRHGGQRYNLRLTSNGKLLLTK